MFVAFLLIAILVLIISLVYCFTAKRKKSVKIFVFSLMALIIAHGVCSFMSVGFIVPSKLHKSEICSYIENSETKSNSPKIKQKMKKGQIIDINCSDSGNGNYYYVSAVYLGDEKPNKKDVKSNIFGCDLSIVHNYKGKNFWYASSTVLPIGIESDFFFGGLYPGEYKNKFAWYRNGILVDSESGTDTKEICKKIDEINKQI